MGPRGWNSWELGAGSWDRADELAWRWALGLTLRDERSDRTSNQEWQGEGGKRREGEKEERGKGGKKEVVNNPSHMLGIPAQPFLHSCFLPNHVDVASDLRRQIQQEPVTMKLSPITIPPDQGLALFIS